MKERPILFSAPMVRATLEGRKTQTRRVCKPMNKWVDQECREVRTVNGEPFHFLKGATAPIEKLLCPYGQPGDKLWVRETAQHYKMPNFLTGEPTTADAGQYCADGEPVLIDGGYDAAWWYSRPTCPAIHLPRWASRILLEVVSVRVERLQDISEEDAEQEGISQDYADNAQMIAEAMNCQEPDPFTSCFKILWEDINGAKSWDANPWVWAIKFRVLKP